MQWLAYLGGAAGLAGLVASLFLRWQLEKARRAADAAQASAKASGERLVLKEASWLEAGTRQEALIRVLRANAEAQRRRVSDLARRHPELAREFFLSVLTDAGAGAIPAPAEGPATGEPTTGGGAR